MRRTDHILNQLLTDGGHVIRTRDHPELVSTIRRREDAGLLTSVLPGTLVPTALLGDVTVRARAAQAWSPDAVIVGDTAAQLTFFPELGNRVPIELALARPPRCERSGFHLVQRHVPPELITTRGGLRVSSPALTALDLCQTREGDGIDRALFRRATTLAHLHHAMDLTPGRRGNIDRRRLLLDSRDEPWARSERLAHRLLRDHDIRGWKANLAVELDETTMYLDVGFARLKLAVEIDGYEVHIDRETFEHDRRRQNLLVTHGWLVLRFTWRMVVDEPAIVVSTILRAIGLLTGNGPSRGGYSRR